jgi:hypothetical protein
MPVNWTSRISRNWCYHNAVDVRTLDHRAIPRLTVKYKTLRVTPRLTYPGVFAVAS